MASDQSIASPVTGILSLPDELLVSILSWIPYAFYSHKSIFATNKRFNSVMKTKSLPEQVAKNQFPTIYQVKMALTEPPFRNCHLQHISRIYKSRIKWRDSLMERTSQSRFVIDTATALLYGYTRKWKAIIGLPLTMLNAHQSVIGFVQHARVVRSMPPEALLLLTYIENIAYEILLEELEFDVLAHCSYETSVIFGARPMELCIRSLSDFMFLISHISPPTLASITSIYPNVFASHMHTKTSFTELILETLHANSLRTNPVDVMEKYCVLAFAKQVALMKLTEPGGYLESIEWNEELLPEAEPSEDEPSGDEPPEDEPSEGEPSEAESSTAESSESETIQINQVFVSKLVREAARRDVIDSEIKAIFSDEARALEIASSIDLAQAVLDMEDAFDENQGTFALSSVDEIVAEEFLLQGIDPWP